MREKPLRRRLALVKIGGGSTLRLLGSGLPAFRPRKVWSEYLTLGSGLVGNGEAASFWPGDVLLAPSQIVLNTDTGIPR